MSVTDNLVRASSVAYMLNTQQYSPSCLQCKFITLLVACIDKWVKSKFEDATPPELCSGPKLAIWYKNQPPGPEKTPGHGEKSKLAILPLFGHAKVLGEKNNT